MAVLVLFALKLTQENKIILAVIVYAVSVHVKIYPVVYALQIYLYLRSKTNGKDSSKSLTDFIKDLWPNRRRWEDSNCKQIFNCPSPDERHIRQGEDSNCKQIFNCPSPDERHIRQGEQLKI
jgi:hypothetical protein